MPFYQFNVLFDLTEEERQGLVERVNKIHTRKFGVPTLFMNVAFMDMRKTGAHVYHGGMPGMLNTVQCLIRPGKRTKAEFDEVVREVAQAWHDVINGGKARGNGMRELQGVFVQPVIAAAMEWGIVLPEGGGDRQWLVDHRAEFEQLAAGGSKEFQALLREMEEREDLQLDYSPAKQNGH